ncbi:MAG: AhpC/TSA family protein [Bacteroidales bacterium]|nr:AhpC/TSA family protein [Bacteroidales bacterium]
MKNKLLLPLALSVLGALTCSAKDVKYDVKGTKAPKDGAKVYIINPVGKVRIDSTVVSKGTFQMKGKAEEDALLAITVDGVDGQIPFFNDGRPVQVNVADGILTGSALNTKLSVCDRRNKAEYDDYKRFIDAFASLPEEEQMAQAQEWAPKYDAKIKAYADFYIGMVEENKESLIPVAFIEQLPSLVSAADNWNKKAGEDKLEELLSANPRIAAHPVVVDLKKRMAADDAARKERAARHVEVVGGKFLDYEGPDPNGVMHKLSEFVGQGKWVLVDFWASWCAPCKGEMPNVVTAYELYHDKGLEIVGISFDREKEPWLAAIKEWKMPWIHLYGIQDGKSIAAEIYGVTGIPDNVLVDPEGTVVARSLRGQDLADRISKIFE